MRHCINTWQILYGTKHRTLIKFFIVYMFTTLVSLKMRLCNSYKMDQGND